MSEEKKEKAIVATRTEGVLSLPYGCDPALVYEEAEKLEIVKRALDDLCDKDIVEGIALVFTYDSGIVRQEDLLRRLKLPESRRFKEAHERGIAKIRKSVREGGYATPRENRPRGRRR
jgi:hypothetical protein